MACSDFPKFLGIGNLPAPSNIVVNGALQVPARRFWGVYSWVGGGTRYAIRSAASPETGPETDIAGRTRGRSRLRSPESPGSTQEPPQGTACRQATNATAHYLPTRPAAGNRQAEEF